MANIVRDGTKRVGCVLGQCTAYFASAMRLTQRKHHVGRKSIKARMYRLLSFENDVLGADPLGTTLGTNVYAYALV